MECCSFTEGPEYIQECLSRIITDAAQGAIWFLIIEAKIRTGEITAKKSGGEWLYQPTARKGGKHGRGKVRAKGKGIRASGR